MAFHNATSRANAWQAHTYAEIAELGSRSGSVLVVPVGSTEQHGHHLPVGTDSMLAEAVAHGAVERVADAVPVLVTPTIWTGYSPHHLPFGGTISIEADELTSLLERTVETATESGFDAVLLVNGHGGNASIVDVATSTIGEANPETEVLGLTYFTLADAFIDEIRDSDTGGMGHGGEFETSLMVHLYPDLVEEDRIEGTTFEDPYDLTRDDLFEGGPLSVYRPFDEYSESGAIGDPELASADKGERLYARLSERLAELLEEISDRNGGD